MSEIDNLFKKIMRGEIPSDKVYEDEYVFAFKDIMPTAPTHILIIPKAPIDSLNELTDDDAFWRGCGTPGHPCCVNFDVLERSGRKYCVCTGMLYDPKEHVGEPLPVELPASVVEKLKIES